MADFYKYHALGNDYIVIDPNKTHIQLNPDVIKLLCDRNFGIGGDGVLYGPIIPEDKIELRIFNPDGGEAEKSGNGIRIFSRYLLDEGYVHTHKFTLQTLGGKVFVEVFENKNGIITVDMGTVTFHSESIPVAGEIREVINESFIINGDEYFITCLSIGNPHCVIPLDTISKDLALRLGPIIENNELFPKRINMQLLKVIDRNTIQIEIWERGAGYTLASGSSSCAAASAAFALGMVEKKVEVRMPGGIINIEIKEDGHVFMTGPVAGVVRGEFSKDLLREMKKLV